MFGSSVWNVRHVTLLAPGILRWLLNFWKICVLPWNRLGSQLLSRSIAVISKLRDPKAGTCWQVIRFSYENRYTFFFFTFYLFNRLPDYDVKNVEKVLGAHCLPLEGQSWTTKYQTVDRSGRSFVLVKYLCCRNAKPCTDSRGDSVLVAIQALSHKDFWGNWHSPVCCL
jgi:hypothetical protein